MKVQVHCKRNTCTDRDGLKGEKNSSCQYHLISGGMTEVELTR